MFNHYIVHLNLIKYNIVYQLFLNSKMIRQVNLKTNRDVRYQLEIYLTSFTINTSFYKAKNSFLKTLIFYLNNF